MTSKKRNIDSNKELLLLAAEMKQLETRKMEFVSTVMKNLKKTIPEWSHQIPLKEFRIAVRNLFVENRLQTSGSDYFGWTSKVKVQSDFDSFCKSLKKKKLAFYYDPYFSRFFDLRKFKMKSTSRSSTEMESYTVNEDGNLLYQYSGTSYHGFGSIDDTVQYEMEIDLSSGSVKEFSDSTMRYDWDNSSHHKIDTKILTETFFNQKQVK